MLSGKSGTSKVLPREFRKIAEKLFAPAGSSKLRKLSLDDTEAFAVNLGIGDDYKKLLKEIKNSPVREQAMGKFLERFQNNLDLLIQKTWVEKADEARKNALLDKVPPFITLIEKEQLPEALKEFGIILEELAYLFFGGQSQKDDFTEYTFRIDIQMGLFWWYGSKLGNFENSAQAKSTNPDVLLAVLLLGVCYLTNF